LKHSKFQLIILLLIFLSKNLFIMNFKSCIAVVSITVFSVFAALTSNAQISTVDSLENVLKNHTKDDTVKVNLLNEISKKCYSNNFEKARAYAVQSGELADRLNFSKGKAQSLFFIGNTYIRQGDTLALDYLQKSIKICEEINFKSQIVKCLNSIGVVYIQNGRIPKAIETLEKALKVAEELNSKSDIGMIRLNIAALKSNIGKIDEAINEYINILKDINEISDKKLAYNVYNNLGLNYGKQGNYPMALEYYQKSLKLAEERNDKEAILVIVNNISGIYTSLKDYSKALELSEKSLVLAQEMNEKPRISNALREIGLIYRKMKNPLALEYFQKSLKVSEEINQISSIVGSLNYIGFYYIEMEEYDSALKVFQDALEKSERIQLRAGIMNSLNGLCSINIKQKNYGKALNYALRNLELSKSMKSLTIKKDIHNQLSQIYAATHDYKNAFQNYKLYKKLNDSVYKDENIKRIAELEYSYKFEKEKQAIELEQQKKDAIQAAKRRQQNTAIIFLGICFVLTLFLALYIYRLYRYKHQTNLLLTKQKNEIQELNEEQMALNEELRQSNEQLFYAKEVIEERENLLTQITNNIPVFISLLNSKLEYVFANNGYAQVFNKSTKELSGMNITDVLDNEYLDRANSHIDKALKGETVSYENYMPTASNDKQYIQTTYVPYYFHNDLQGVLVCSADITQRKLAEQALREVEQERKRLLEAEIERINRELETNQKSMTAATLKLIQNSERDADTINRLAEIEKNTNAEGKRSISSLITDYKHLSYNSNWDEFEILFEKVHSSFYERLNDLYPDLTANERKICAFLKLNMSSKDIANITFQSDEALKKARLRLRQKLGIDRETNLVVFLQNI
jgi:PAS domain S-box-containing protein